MRRTKKHPRNLLVVEEEFEEIEEIRLVLKRGFPAWPIEVISTEVAFCAAFDRLLADPPALVVMDVMLRWENTKPDKVPQPREVGQQGARRAGIRCQRLLAECPETCDVPVILFTHLRETDLKSSLEEVPDHVRYLAKSEGTEKLLELAMQLVRS